MALTMDQLNAAYNNMSIYGDSYGVDGNKTQIDNSSGINNIDLTSAPINNIQPYLPIINQGGDNDGSGITGIPSYGYESSYAGTNTTPEENESFLYDIGEGSIDQADINNNKKGLAGILELYQKYSPLANIIRGGKNLATQSYNFIKDKREEARIQKEKDLMAEIQASNLAAAQKAEQATLDTTYAAQSQSKRDQIQQNTGGQYDRAGSKAEYNRDPTGYSGSFKKGGRTGYGTGGIVTL